ncbi:MAG: hypothetical protein OXN21_04725 [Chloroflexota bacterium]|nr:hypothetical protein [Chloroflexota bacterium]
MAEGQIRSNQELGQLIEKKKYPRQLQQVEVKKNGAFAVCRFGLRLEFCGRRGGSYYGI